MKSLRAQYVSCVGAYVATGEELFLAEVEELARDATDEGRRLEEMAGLHEAALLALVENGVACDAAAIRRASACLSAFMVSATVFHQAQVDLIHYDRSRAYGERARQRLETLGQLIGGMAHEVSNLLQPVVGLCELSLLDLPEGAPERENLEIISGCAARASGVLRNLLAYGRHAERDMKLAAFGAAVRRSMAFVSSISMLWPTLTVAIDDERSRALVVEEELTQILLNLIQNAQQANARRIDISVKRTFWRFHSEAEDARPRQPALRLAVRDDGDGMDGETLTRACIPFFSGKPPGEGSGMGLAVVGGIVKSWCGQLTLTSQAGEGTTVSIYLPVDKLDCAAEPRESSAPAQPPP